jgi:glycolate oxidase iron-sulfur subunit
MQGIHKEPRNLVRQNYKIVEMADPNACCGFGGITMQTEKQHLSQAVGASKAKMIADTEAEIVSAECSACRMQINNSMGIESKTVFKNPIELIAEALKEN